MDFRKKEAVMRVGDGNSRLAADEWSAVGDLIENCINLAGMNELYSCRVRGKAIAMMARQRDKAVGNGVRAAARVPSPKLKNGKFTCDDCIHSFWNPFDQRFCAKGRTANQLCKRFEKKKR
jgi:hypothetical protein